MKKLICVKEVEEACKNGKKSICIDADTLITPSAKDVADSLGVEFLKGEACCHENESEGTFKEEVKVSSCKDGGIDSELIFKALSAMMQKGLIDGSGLTCCNSDSAYLSESHGNGLKVVRGKSVRMDEFDTGNPNANVSYQELVHKEESQMSAGFLVIDNSSFEWGLTYDEIDYVIEGTVVVTIDGKPYTAHAGDVLFVPKGSNVVWGSPDKARIFYTTYPANWPDLL